MRHKSEAVKKFLNDVKEVCRKHGLSLEHEDSQGAFEVNTYSLESEMWLLAAADKTEESA